MTPPQISSNRGRPGRNIMIAAWLVLAAVSIAIILERLSITVDLAYFLPAPTSEQEHVLLDRLGQGPGSQLVFISVSGQERETAVGKSVRLTQALAASSLFSNVLNGQEELTRESIPDIVWDNRYLLTDVDASADGLRRALRMRLADLAVFAGTDFSDLVAADPHLAAIDVIENLSWSDLAAMTEWTGPDGRSAFLIAEVTAPAFDLDGQAEAIATIHSEAARVNAAPVVLNGVGVYGVELQRTIKSEAQFRSILASLAIIVVLFIAYRNVAIIVLAAVPLTLGALAGIASVALLFGQIHGITLAFGFTLFGVAVDYPLHLFSHSRERHPKDAIRSVWPTMRLGAISTIIAYLSISVSGSRGLAQLGVMSSIGILVALAATRTLLPSLIPQKQPATISNDVPDAEEIRPTLGHAVWISVLTIGALIIVWQGSIWSNDLSTLTPIEPEKLRRDNELRAVLGAPDIRYLIALRAPTEQAALEATEALAYHLNSARSDNVLDDFRVATAVLPSLRTQLARQSALGSAGNAAAAIRQATTGMPFRAGEFAPYVAALDAATKQDPLCAADFTDSQLSGFLDAHLYFDGTDWISLATLFGLSNPGRLAMRLADSYPDAALVDLKFASQELVRDYRQRIHLVLFGALVLILIILIMRVGFTKRLVWIAGTLSAAAIGTIAVNSLFMEQLSIFNLIALMLVAGLGLDYGLFISRAEADPVQGAHTSHAVLVCVTSTLLAFLILAFSSVPILSSIGTTVAIGVFLNYAVAKLGSRHS